MPDLLPWPIEAVILVCSDPEEARTDQMDSVHPGKCRDCGGPVVYDGWSMRRIDGCLERQGRPVELLCTQCFPKYDFNTVGVFEDHRFRKQAPA